VFLRIAAVAAPVNDVKRSNYANADRLVFPWPEAIALVTINRHFAVDVPGD